LIIPIDSYLAFMACCKMNEEAQHDCCGPAQTCCQTWCPDSSEQHVFKQGVQNSRLPVLLGSGLVEAAKTPQSPLKCYALCKRFAFPKYEEEFFRLSNGLYEQLIQHLDPTEEWLEGVVRSFRGSFGRLASSSIADCEVLLHKNDCDRVPKAGDVVRFRLKKNSRGIPEAVDAKVVLRSKKLGK